MPANRPLTGVLREDRRAAVVGAIDTTQSNQISVTR
jgi:hypothetical protein